MRAEQLETTPFITSEHGKRRRTPLAVLPRARIARPKRRARSGGSMAVKIGVCFGVFLLVMAIQLLFDPFGRASVETGGTAPNPDEGTDETLGRLRFVSGGNVSSVFSGAQRWSAPVSDAASFTTRADSIMEIQALAGDVVSCPASGEVREIGTDGALGEYLRIAHGNGLESIYYNLQSVLVELGQPVLALDTLGTVGESGTLYVSVLQSGQEQPPEDYILVRQGS